MPKVCVLYHCTSYGHIGQIEEAVAEGARSMEGTVVSSSACSNWCLRRSLRNPAASLIRPRQSRRCRSLPTARPPSWTSDALADGPPDRRPLGSRSIHRQGSAALA